MKSCTICRDNPSHHITSIWNFQCIFLKTMASLSSNSGSENFPEISSTQINDALICKFFSIFRKLWKFNIHISSKIKKICFLKKQTFFSLGFLFEITYFCMLSNVIFHLKKSAFLISVRVVILITLNLFLVLIFIVTHVGAFCFTLWKILHKERRCWSITFQNVTFELSF